MTKYPKSSTNPVIRKKNNPNQHVKTSHPDTTEKHSQKGVENQSQKELIAVQLIEIN
jgi:hypothetical protein